MPSFLPPTAPKEIQFSKSDLDISESAPTPKTSLLLKDQDKDRDRIIEDYRRGGYWTAAANLLGISERALLEQRKRQGINKKGHLNTRSLKL